MLIERTRSGLERAKQQGKTLGRKSTLNDTKKAEVLAKLAVGESVSGIAKAFSTTRQTIMRVRDAA